MLGMLFTAAPSNDVVRELQDKVISIQDHEIAFLNGTIAIWAAGTGILVAIALVVIGFANNKAKKNMEDATDKLKDAEKKISDLESKIAEANKILADTKSMANIAQDKLTELENEQEEIKKTTIRLNTNSTLEVTISNIKRAFDNSKEVLQSLPIDEGTVDFERRASLLKEHSKLMARFNNIQKGFQIAKIYGRDFEKISDLLGLHEEVSVFYDDCRTFNEDMNIY
ncbi:hypothetical protein IEQ_05136 [Bacillus cereus BAG6X1-2]|nr:hypothetical protein IEQ_05136 [Bacillus cereus BAG6X1-2]